MGGYRVKLPVSFNKCVFFIRLCEIDPPIEFQCSLCKPIPRGHISLK